MSAVALARSVRIRPSAVRLAALAAVLVGSVADAQTWKFEPFVSLRETLTDNVELRPKGFEQEDLITQFTPGFRINAKSARATLAGYASFPMLLYARTGDENNRIYPTVNLNGHIELVDRFFFLDAAAYATQNLVTPFGAQPGDLTNATDNRYTSTTYRISPYIKGVTGGGTQYELRNTNTWTSPSNAQESLRGAYTNEWRGRVATPVNPVGLIVDFDRSSVDFSNEEALVTEEVRVRAAYQASPSLRFLIGAGYEDNQFRFTSHRGATYGAGVEWHPTIRTRARATWEQRFFGPSYVLDVDHRASLSVWRLRAGRSISTYPQLVGTIPAGGDVQGLLNEVLTTRIPDPAERQTAVDQLISDLGIPMVLDGPVSFYTEEVLLREYATATVGMLGVRNRVFVTVFRVRTEPIVGSGSLLPPTLSSNNNTQVGSQVSWSYELSGSTNLTATATVTETTTNAPFDAKTNQSKVRLEATTRISPHTSFVAGARYQTFSSDVATDFNEAAIYVGVTYRFR